MVKRAEQVAGPGTRVTCPKCGETIGYLRQSLYQGWTFGLDAIRFAHGKGPYREPGTEALKAQCQLCETPYSDTVTTLKHGSRLRVHTEHGWLGGEPLTGTVQKVRLDG